MTRTETTGYESITQHYGRLVSDSLPAPEVTLAGFLAHAKGQPRYYWESSRDSVAFAGSGTAIEVVGWGDTRFQTVRFHAAELFAGAIQFNMDEPLAAPRLFGGFSFRQDFIPDQTWADFTPAHFVLPHYQLVSVAGEKWLTINTNVPFGENPFALRDELRDALRAKIAELQAHEATIPAAPTPKLLDMRYPMTFETWESLITDATDRMKRGDLQKVVLSRVAEAQFDQRVDVLPPLRYLAQTYPETYRFLFEPRPFHAFYGATPELLVQVTGDHVKTMALAGSSPRGDTPAADDAYAQGLLDSEKDRYEHQLVIDEIQRRLTPLTMALQVGETGIMRLSNIHHIHTPISGTLKGRNGVLPIVEALHPTPALGGQPQAEAMALIQHMESVPRGWYGAPIGWIDQNMDGQFGVGIRSAVAQDRRVWLYAGVGLVSASDPRKEWDETTLKFTPMRRALGIQ